MHTGARSEVHNLEALVLATCNGFCIALAYSAQIRRMSVPFYARTLPRTSERDFLCCHVLGFEQLLV